MSENLITKLNSEEAVGFIKLDSDIESVFISEEIILRKTTSDDFLNWFGLKFTPVKDGKSVERVQTGKFDKSPLHFNNFNSIDVNEFNYALIGPVEKIRPKVNAFNNALSLWSTGSSCVNFIFSEHTHSPFYPFGDWRGLPPSPLQLSEWKDFLDFIREVEKSDGKKFRLLLDRFRHAIQQGNNLKDHNRFLDLITILEMAFVPDGNQGEIVFKFRMRASKYLSTVLKREAKELSSTFKKWYEARSALVHSGESASISMDDWKFLVHCTRIAIVEFMRNPKNFDAATLNELLLR
jgi:hypothetical protein